MSHKVEFSVTWRPLERSDIEFKVFQDDHQLGTLKVSKGSLVWFPGKTHKNGRKVSWEKFDTLMNQATRTEAR
jgi:hypothetical protein